MYIELHSASAFSFLEGASLPEELAAQSTAWGMPAMGLVDADGVYGAPRFHMAAKKAGIKAHIGAEITVKDFFSSQLEKTEKTFRLPLLVESRAGYQNLCRLVTRMKMRCPKHARPGECAIALAELYEFSEGLVCLTGGDEGVLARALDAEAGEVDATLCLGDLVGYGPNPNECVDRVRQLPQLTCLAGNHDWAALGKIDLNMFNSEARKAAEWTSDQLRDDVRDYLKALPAKLETEEFALAHGSSRDPIWEYLVVEYQGPPNFEEFQTASCFVGHTHVPKTFLEVDRDRSHPRNVFVPWVSPT